MTPLDHAALRSLLKKATPGPWVLDDEPPRADEYGQRIVSVPRAVSVAHHIEEDHDARLIVAAVNAFPHLLDDSERLAKRDAEILAALKRADALTQDTQSIGEAVQALIDMVRLARSQRDEAERERNQLRELIGDQESACEACPEGCRAEATHHLCDEHYRHAVRVDRVPGDEDIIDVWNDNHAHRYAPMATVTDLRDQLAALRGSLHDLLGALVLARNPDGLLAGAAVCPNWEVARKAIEQARSVLSAAPPAAQKESLTDEQRRAILSADFEVSCPGIVPPAGKKET